jgi:hypothetical protein
MAPYLQAAAASGRSQVAAVGCAQEFQRVWTARKRDTNPGGCPQFSFTKEQRRVSVFYVYIFDEQMGPGFIKICSYFPYPVKVWVNGHEWAKRQAAAAGIEFTALSNGFASAEDPAGLQDICDRFGPGTVQVWFQRWMAKIPLPLDDDDRDAGYWWELSMRQVETSRTLVFDDDVHARAFFEALLCENMDLGRPENVELLFRRGERRGQPAAAPPGGGFRTTIDRYCHMVTVNVFYKNSRVKQYLKDGVALRIETVINSPDDLGCRRMLANLPELQAKARAINDRLLHTETAGQGTVLVSPVIERITRPTVTGDGRKAPALRFGDLRVQALAGALAAMLFTVTGITNRSLCALMTGLLHRPYSMNQASYDLARLSPQRPHRQGSRAQPLHPDPRRAPVRLLLHPRLRPRPPPAHGTRPAQRPARTHRGAGHPRPAHRRAHHPGARPHRCLSPAVTRSIHRCRRTQLRPPGRTIDNPS